MGGFWHKLFAAKEQVAVEQEQAAPLVDDVPADDDDWSYSSFAAFNALSEVRLLRVEIQAMSKRLETVERRLDQNERSVTVIQATLEEWRGD